MTSGPPPFAPDAPAGGARGAHAAPSVPPLAAPSAAPSAELLRLLADNVPVLIAYYRTEDFCCGFANLQYARAFGHDTQSIIGCSLASIVGEEALAHIQPHVDVVLRERRSVAYERTLPGADGSERCVAVDLLPHTADLPADAAPGSLPEIIGAFVLIADITRHRVAEQAVRESEERLG